jgi:F-type H+-transporting ATPase subunit c
MNEMLYLGLGYLGAGLGAGLVICGAAMGIGKLGAAGAEGTARQPEASKDIRTTMLIPAVLIEGLGFFALVLCFLIVFNVSAPKQPMAETATAATSTTH